jgi:hypothetical protein
MQTYQPDSPSRMCDGSLDEAARMFDRAWWLSVGRDKFMRIHTYVYMSLKQPYPRVYTHHRLHFGPRVAHCPQATHTSASSELPSPFPTRMSLHHLTPSHSPHPISLA